ncbi:MAG: ribosome maturation factor RimP [Thermaerobacterales bacterium]
MTKKRWVPMGNLESAGNKFEQAVAQVAEDMGVPWYCLEIGRQGKDPLVQVAIDLKGGVGIEECQLFSRRLNAVLENLEIDGGSYHLEVSSPGLDRELKNERDFEYFKGRTVLVTTYAPVEGRKRFVGILHGLQDDQIQVVGDDELWAIPRDRIAKVRLQPVF